ncbi:MAG: hypothetical protein GWO24_37485, partial [Akkermansiaceae bacterium]|nr:hypothetical protein [Akkermansiaceae bacterium]
PAGGGGPGWIRTGITIPGDEWTHVAWRNTGSGPENIELLVNGEPSFLGSGVGAPSGLMNIAIRHNGVEGYEGLIDDVRLYAVALNDDQIQGLLEGGPAEDTLKLDVNASGDDLVLTWMSRPGLLYRVRSDEDLQPEPASWPVFDDNEDLEATPPLNTLTIPRPAASGAYFVVEEYFPPPVSVFSDDFESGQGDWTIGSDGGDGTAWEFGLPVVVGPAPPVASTACVGTNLSSDYALNANVWLLSPVIDLTTAAGATLHFRQFKDIEEGFDFGSLRVLDADNGDAELVVLLDAESGVTLDWEEEKISLPEVALGRNVKIEFRLQSDDVQNFAGWYIDDVEMTVP